MKLSSLLFTIGILIGLAMAGPAFGREDKANQTIDSTVAVIPLKSSNAVEVATVLDEAFNGLGTNRKIRVVIFAVPMTDWLFIHATNSDLQTIRGLLKPL